MDLRSQQGVKFLFYSEDIGRDVVLKVPDLLVSDRIFPVFARGLVGSMLWLG